MYRDLAGVLAHHGAGHVGAVPYIPAMADATSFERLCSLFARSLLDQAHAYESDQLSKFQRSRLGEAMTAEIRKLGDMAFPAARAFKVSVAAKGLADSLGQDLNQHTWHSQKKLDGYKTLTYEHFFPVREIRLELAKQSTASGAMRVLDRMLWVAWITKQEDARLRERGYGSIRPDPVLAYREAGIELLPQYPPIVGPTRPPPDCAACGSSGGWLVTGGSRSNSPGRLLVYCERCRHERAEDLGVALPLAVFEEDPEGIIAALYAGGATRSDAAHVMGMLDVPSWRPFPVDSGSAQSNMPPTTPQAPPTASEGARERMTWKPGDVNVTPPLPTTPSTAHGATPSEPGFMAVASGDTFETVQLGLCLGGVVKLFAAGGASTWSVGSDTTLFEAQCRGDLARTPQSQDATREAAVFNAGTGTLLLQQRRPIEMHSTIEGQQISLDGAVVQLAPSGEPPAATEGTDLGELLERAVNVALNARGQLRIETGGWDAPTTPFCSVELAHLDDGTEALYFETSPAPAQTRWWNQNLRHVAGDTVAMVLRADDFTRDQVALLLRDAMRWDVSQWDLVFTYRKPPEEVFKT